MNTLQLATPPPAFSPIVVDSLFSRVMLAIDFSAASLGAARWATTHVASQKEAVLMHVVPSDDEPPCLEVHHDTDDPLRQMTPAITGGLGGFAATLDLESTRSVVQVGRPSRCLAAVANEAEASLLVLGRRAAANRVRVGEPNVIERVARRTNASVLVVPEGTTRAPDHVLAAVDASPVASLVLRVASRLARLHEIPLTVLHVLSPISGAYDRIIGTAKRLLGPEQHHGSKGLATSKVVTSLSPGKTRWLVQLGSAHNVIGRDSTQIAMGDPAREIARRATERDAALVVIGTRGADEAPVGSIGSVARELLTRAPVPVLAIAAI